MCLIGIRKNRQGSCAGFKFLDLSLDRSLVRLPCNKIFQLWYLPHPIKDSSPGYCKDFGGRVLAVSFGVESNLQLEGRRIGEVLGVTFQRRVQVILHALEILLLLAPVCMERELKNMIPSECD